MDRAEQRGGLLWLMLALLAAFTLLFFLAFFNRFAGLRSGDGEFSGGMALLSGQLPYRDYFTAGPPLNAIKSAVLLQLFGKTLFVSRMAAVVERLGMAYVLFFWLVQLFRPWTALIASAAAIVLSAGDLTDPVASYNHDAVLFAMVSGLAASYALDRRSPKGLAGLAVLAGLFSALSALTKQTVGLGGGACIFLAMLGLVWMLDGRRKAALWVGGFSAGAMFPLGSVAFWLSHEQILRAALRMMFVTGPSAKAGHRGDFFVHEIVAAYVYRFWLPWAVAAVWLSWGAARRGFYKWNAAVPSAKERSLTTAIGFGVLILAEALAFASTPQMHNVSKGAVYFTTVGLTIWTIAIADSRTRFESNRRWAKALLFALAGWAVAMMLSLSWPAFEAMLVPGFGFLTAAILDGANDRFRWAPYCAIALLIFLQVKEKLDVPFGFGDQNEAGVRFASARSEQGELRGLVLPPATVDFLDQTVRVVAASAKPGDTIFTYPEMGILYTLTNRRPPTWATSHNIDVVNDQLARDDAARLLNARPAVLICYELPSQDLRFDELFWRNGKLSGQRDLMEAVHRLAATYKLAGTYVIANGDPPISVYVRH